jgi:hypothetical protein
VAGDLLVGLLATVTASGIFCFVYTPEIDAMLEEIAQLVFNQIIL